MTAVERPCDDNSVIPPVLRHREARSDPGAWCGDVDCHGLQPRNNKVRPVLQ